MYFVLNYKQKKTERHWYCNTLTVHSLRSLVFFFFSSQEKHNFVLVFLVCTDNRLFFQKQHQQKKIKKTKRKTIALKEICFFLDELRDKLTCTNSIFFLHTQICFFGVYQNVFTDILVLVSVAHRVHSTQHR